MKLHENEAGNGLLPEQNCHAERSEASGRRIRAALHYARDPDLSPMAQDDVVRWCSGIEIMQFHLASIFQTFPLAETFTVIFAEKQENIRDEAPAEGLRRARSNGTAGLAILIFSSWLDGVFVMSSASVIMRLYCVLWKSRKCNAN